MKLVPLRQMIFVPMAATLVGVAVGMVGVLGGDLLSLGFTPLQKRIIAFGFPIWFLVLGSAHAISVYLKCRRAGRQSTRD